MQWLNRLICKHFGHRTSGKNKLTGTSGMLISGHMQPADEHQAYVFSTCRRCGVPFCVGKLDRPDEWRPRGTDTMSPRLFAEAPRFHRGGFVTPLGANEKPVVLDPGYSYIMSEPMRSTIANMEPPAPAPAPFEPGGGSYAGGGASGTWSDDSSSSSSSSDCSSSSSSD